MSDPTTPPVPPAAGTARIVKVMVHVEYPCPKCGRPSVRMGLADVTPDGRIGEPTYWQADAQCNDCKREERDAHNAAVLDARDRRKAQEKWAAQHAPSLKPKPEVRR